MTGAAVLRSCPKTGRTNPVLPMWAYSNDWWFLVLSPFASAGKRCRPCSLEFPGKPSFLFCLNQNKTRYLFLLFMTFVHPSLPLRQCSPTLGLQIFFGPQLPEAFTTTSAGQDFWELKSKDIWRPKVGDHCLT